MASFQFTCPYCSGAFEVDEPPAGQAVVCPHCGGEMALPAELPRPVDEPMVAAEVFETPIRSVSADAAEPTIAFNLHKPIQQSAPPLIQIQEQSAPRIEIRRLGHEEKERRRMWRSLALMIAGITILTVAAILLSRI